MARRVGKKYGWLYGGKMNTEKTNNGGGEETTHPSGVAFEGKSKW